MTRKYMYASRSPVRTFLHASTQKAPIAPLILNNLCVSVKSYYFCTVAEEHRVFTTGNSTRRGAEMLFRVTQGLSQLHELCDRENYLSDG